MSIKSFHILFIIFAFAATLWLGIWGLNESLWLGILSFFVGGGLVVYGVQVLKKFKTIS